MPITVINGPAKSGKSRLANALRNSQITNGKGALLVDDTNDGEIKPLLEKLLVGIELPRKPPADLSTLPWKDDPLVIVVGAKAGILDDFEAALPGFKKFFGPVTTLTTALVADSA
jgi:hypothetical protein